MTAVLAAVILFPAAICLMVIGWRRQDWRYAAVGAVTSFALTVISVVTR